MSIIEDRAFIFSLKDNLQRDFPFSREENYRSLAQYFSFWCISDTLMLSGVDIEVNELSSILMNGFKLDGKEERVYCVKNAVELMFLLGKSTFYDVELVAKMRGELKHFGGYRKEDSDYSFALALENTENFDPLLTASDLFLSNWNGGISYTSQRELAFLSLNGYLIQRGFVPITITKERIDEFKSAIYFFSNDNDPNPFRDFVAHQEHISIYNFLCYMIKKDKGQLKS